MTSDDHSARESVRFGGITVAGHTDAPRAASLVLNKDTSPSSKLRKKSSVRRKPKRLVALGMESPHRKSKVAVPETSEQPAEPPSDAAKYTFDLNISMCKIEVNLKSPRLALNSVVTYAVCAVGS